MPDVRLGTAVAALLLAPLQFLTAQSFAPRVEGRPSLLPGEKVRIWSTDPVFFFRPPLSFGMRHPRLVGTLLPPPTPDSLALRRTALILGPWASRHRAVHWGSVSRVDVADGRLGAAGGAGGAVAGLVSAALLAFSYSYISFAGSLGERRPDLGTITVRFAAVLVPVGAIWGARLTKWRKVY